MSNYEIINLKQKKKWDGIVKSFIKYDVHYLNAYNQAYFLEDGNEALLFYFDFNNTKAIYVFIKRSLKDLPYLPADSIYKDYFDIISPYGYGGFIIEGEDSDIVFRDFEEYCRENKIITITTRLHLFNSQQQEHIWATFSPQDNIVRNLDLNEEELIRNFKYSFRKSLKSAQHNNLSILVDEDGKTLDDFINIYYSTMRRTNADKGYYFSKDFFTQVNKMNGNFIYFYVVYQERTVAAELVLYGPENCYSFLGGTLDEYFELHPNHYLKFEIMKWAKGKGLKRFVLGGGLGNDGIFSYKRSMAPNGVIPYKVSLRVINQEIYDYLMIMHDKFIENDTNKDFFPGYRNL